MDWGWLLFSLDGRVGRTVWWILAGSIPFLGGLIVLYFNGFAEGTRGTNRYGEPYA